MLAHRSGTPLTNPKTDAGIRTVTLPSFLVEAIEAHLSVFGQPGTERVRDGAT